MWIGSGGQVEGGKGASLVEGGKMGVETRKGKVGEGWKGRRWNG